MIRHPHEAMEATQLLRVMQQGPAATADGSDLEAASAGAAAATAASANLTAAWPAARWCTGNSSRDREAVISTAVEWEAKTTGKLGRERSRRPCLE